MCIVRIGITTDIFETFFGHHCRRSFFIKSTSGIYKIEKGQKVVGNCHLAQRDPKVFSVPGSKNVEEFDPTRFNFRVSDHVNNRIFRKQYCLSFLGICC